MPSLHKHHPTFSGYWIHPARGEFPLRPEEHHSHFFQTHRSLFGSDLNAAYEDGWVSIRRWVGDNEVWAIRYHALGPVAGLLFKWAQSVLERHPDETQVAEATAEDLQALITTLVRQDRYVTGNLSGAFETGLLTAIARRAKTLLVKSRDEATEPLVVDEEDIG